LPNLHNWLLLVIDMVRYFVLVC